VTSLPVGFCVNVRHFPSRWWCQLACHYLDIPILFSLIQALKSMARITATCCWDNSCCQPFVLCLVISSPSSRTVLQRTEPMRLLHCCQQTPDFISPQDWPPNSPDLNPMDYAIGGFCRNESTAARSVTSTIWKNDWLKSGVDLIRTLLTEQWTSGVIDCSNVSVLKGDTLNIWFKQFGCSDWHRLCWKLLTCG